jgi:1,2-dihydroxy-3-keto-5-methylthiopentene dioxygenase
MATLIIPEHNQTLEDFSDIQAYLDQRGILIDQWEPAFPIGESAEQEEILKAYQPSLTPYMEKNGYQTADVISVNRNTPNLQELRDKFLKEHTHTEDEVRYFISGRGYFWFHLNENEPVICVKCEAGDLLSVPAGFKHWFDLGDEPAVKVIRIFTDVSGWVAHYTGSRIEERFSQGQVAV